MARLPASPLALLLCVSAGGCLGGDDGPAAGDGDAPRGQGPEARHVVFYLNGGPGLQRAAPDKADPDRVTAPSFYRSWAAGEDQPTFTGAPLAAGLVARNAILTFSYTTDQVVATTGPQDQGFPEFVVYFGAVDAPMAWASVQGEDAVRPGDVVELNVTLNLPQGGLVVPAGRTPAVIISPVQAQADAGFTLDLLVNGTEAASRVVLETETLAFGTQGTGTPTEVDGRLVGSAYVLGVSDGTTAASHPFDVTAATVGVRLRLERVQGVGVADIDMQALAPNGTVAAQSVTPMPHEGIDLYAPNLAWGGTGTWQVRVVNYGHVLVEYRVTITVLADTPAA